MKYQNSSLFFKGSANIKIAMQCFEIFGGRGNAQMLPPLVAGLSCVVVFDGRCPVKFLTSEISDFKPCAHAQNNTLHIKYAEKTDD